MEEKVTQCDACHHMARCYSAVLQGHDVWMCFDYNLCLRSARNLRIGMWA
jgi:hypothetical protein